MGTKLITEFAIGDGYFNSRIKLYYRSMYVFGCMTKSDFFGRKDGEAEAKKDVFRDSVARLERIGQIGLVDWDRASRNRHRWRVSGGGQKVNRLETDDTRTLVRNPTHICYRLFRATGPDALFFLTVLLGAAQVRKDNEESIESQGAERANPAQESFFRGFTREDVLSWMLTGTDTWDPAKEEKRFIENARRDMHDSFFRDFELPGLVRRRKHGNTYLLELSDLTMEKLREALAGGSEGRTERFEALIAAMAFFSQTGPFGEIGSMLLDRLSPAERDPALKHAFRIRHFYLSNALNDLNALDLIQAIQNGGWVILTCYDSMEGKRSGCIFCRPLEIRAGAGGREYVACYDPVFRRVRCERLDRIQSVEILRGPCAVWMLAALRGTECRCTVKAGRTDTRELILRPCRYSPEERENAAEPCPAGPCAPLDGLPRFARYEVRGVRRTAYLPYTAEGVPGQELRSDHLVSVEWPGDLRREIEGDIARSRELLAMTWGVSIPYYAPGETLWDVKPVGIRLKVWVWDNEPHILERLRRECRCGSFRRGEGHEQTVELKVTDPQETVPWITSFAGRIRGVESDDPEFVTYIRKRLEALYHAVLDEPGAEPAGYRAQDFRSSNLLRDGKKEAREGWGTTPSPLAVQSPRQPHNQLFSPLFSLEYQNCIGAFEQALPELPGEEAFTPGAERVNILRAEDLRALAGFSRQARKNQSFTPGEYAAILRRLPAISAFAFDLGLPPDTRLMRDLVPLSILERRWLLAILENDKMRLFLPREDILRLRALLERDGPEEKRPLQPLYPPGSMVFFDRYRQEKPEELGAVFREFLRAVRYGTVLQVRYLPQGAREPQAYPVLLLWMEYSPKDDLFRAVCRRLGTGGEDRIVTLRLDRVKAAAAGGRGPESSREAPEPDAIDFRIRFPRKNNLADRILSEMAPYKKTCSFLDQEQVYQLEFTADRHDRLELAISLLHFGASIQILEPEEVLQELKRRLQRQKNLWMQ